MKLERFICDVMSYLARTIKFWIDSFQPEKLETRKKQKMNKNNNETNLDHQIARLREQPLFAMVGRSPDGDVSMELWLKIRSADRTDELEVILN